MLQFALVMATVFGREGVIIAHASANNFCSSVRHEGDFGQCMNNRRVHEDTDIADTDHAVRSFWDRFIDLYISMFLNFMEACKSVNNCMLTSLPACLPNWVLRKFAAILAKPISTIINASLKENQVPACWKLADICPITKCKQVTDINKDLRPTSLTSTLYKIAEDAIIKYDLKPKIMARLDCNQFGFIPGSNTTMALIALVHRWAETVDKEGGCVRSLVTDYRKAFDLIDHKFFIQNAKE